LKRSVTIAHGLGHSSTKTILKLEKGQRFASDSDIVGPSRCLREGPVGVMSELSNFGPRVGRVLRGDGKVEPIKAMALGSEVVAPGRSRFSIDHPAVRARPELFTPVNPKDTDTFRELDRHLTRRRAEARGTTESGDLRHASRSREQRWRL
jgi:hypothetical protein